MTGLGPRPAPLHVLDGQRDGLARAQLAARPLTPCSTNARRVVRAAIASLTVHVDAMRCMNRSRHGVERRSGEPIGKSRRSYESRSLRRGFVCYESLACSRLEHLRRCYRSGRHDDGGSRTGRARFSVANRNPCVSV
jgi:hypothetical protein